MESQTPESEGTAVPTPDNGMSGQDSAPTVETRQTPPELALIEEVLGRKFESPEQAKETLRNLNSLVGDQTTSKQRKALEKLASQAGLSTDELLEVIETQPMNIPQGTEETPVRGAPVRSLPDDTTKRLVRIEMDQLVKDIPEASIVRDQLFAEALTTGKPAVELWTSKYGPLVDAGKKIGAKKLQATLEGQPTRATSTASESSDTQVDFSKLSSQEMEKYLNFANPSPRL